MRVGRSRSQAVDKISRQSYPHFDHSFRARLNTLVSQVNYLKYNEK